MIRMDSIDFAYTPEAPIFRGFCWQIERGEAWAVIGPSGCGKSTLLALLAGLRLPTRGQVLVDGQPLARPRPATGLIIQDYGLLPWATVRQNAELGQRVRRFYGPDGTHAPKMASQAENVRYWIDRLGLTEVAEQYPGQISGGQRQRTAIARTLALHPDLLLMDEPFSSLDAPTRESLQNLTLELWEEQKLTLVTVTHAIEEAAILGRKILILGQPPIERPEILDNPACGSPGFRGSAGYQALCREIRGRLEAAA